MNKSIDKQSNLYNKKAFFKSYPFTLLEVILAVAILSIGFIAAMSIATTAADRLMKAVTRWERQHMLNQATEYFLLAGPDVAIPQEFFPFQGYSTTCQVSPAILPEGIEPEINSWKIVTMKISIFDDRNNEIDVLEVDKIVKVEKQ